MKREFPWAFRPDAAAVEEQWNTSRIALDTNVLLLIYRMSEKSRDQLFKALEALRGRLVIPYQVIEEFLRNREDVLLEQRQAIDELHNAFSVPVKAMGGDKRAPLEMGQLRDLAKTAKDAATKLIQKERDALPDVANDHLLERIASINRGTDRQEANRRGNRRPM
jgi:hypothetical protein